MTDHALYCAMVNWSREATPIPDCDCSGACPPCRKGAHADCEEDRWTRALYGGPCDCRTRGHETVLTPAIR